MLHAILAGDGLLITHIVVYIVVFVACRHGVIDDLSGSAGIEHISIVGLLVKRTWHLFAHRLRCCCNSGILDWHFLLHSDLDLGFFATAGRSVGVLIAAWLDCGDLLAVDCFSIVFLLLSLPFVVALVRVEVIYNTHKDLLD